MHTTINRAWMDDQAKQLSEMTENRTPGEGPGRTRGRPRLEDVAEIPRPGLAGEETISWS